MNFEIYQMKLKPIEIRQQRVEPSVNVKDLLVSRFAMEELAHRGCVGASTTTSTMPDKQQDINTAISASHIHTHLETSTQTSP